ncbi:ABC1 family protein C15C4.02 [Ceratocystis platani]|uniref:ABC1 family protein C15C4.02 n=1 Tax=Ceratocystis fimbriata f. sp. platani TaxID=88771 RepID=A0A0F8B5V4_CERFI|nr:ABC1 family protein C15C4.02 [Ceratocystis platani]
MENITDTEEKNKELHSCHQRCANRTLKVLEKNGGIFIKLGQHLSAMNYLLPVEWTTTFIPLQDKCPISSLESVQEMFRKDTGSEISELFTDFNPVPIGAASLAQVHMAKLKGTTEEVAVKVQHPSLDVFSHLDIKLTSFTFSILKKVFPEYDLEWLAKEMEESLPRELDFREEARNAQRTKEYFSHIPELPLVIPDVVWAKRRILVMAAEKGHRLDDLEYMDENGIDRDEVSASLARIFNEMIFGHNAPLHCDPHGGNLAIRKNNHRRGHNFDVILYDHGLYRDIPEDMRRSYAKMWIAAVDGDMDRMCKYAMEVANIEEKDFPLFASAITGRDYRVVRTSGSMFKKRTDAEQKRMSTMLKDGLIVDLVHLLGKVPPVILLILKTNDLTRSLDENLHTRQGPIRSFMILARYCARTVFQESIDAIKMNGTSMLWPPTAINYLAAWLSFWRVEMKLNVFEWWIYARRALGISSGLSRTLHVHNDSIGAAATAIVSE